MLNTDDSVNHFLQPIISPSLPSHSNTKDGSQREDAEESPTSMVGSYSSTKWFWMSWIVSALLPTPPAPTTTSLYSVMFATGTHHTHGFWREREEGAERRAG